MFTQDYQICILRAQRNVLWDVSFLESLLHNYRTHSKKLRLSCGKPFGKVVKTESCVSTRSCWRGTFFERLISFFGCQNRLLRVQMILLDKNSFRNFFQFLFLWTVSSNFSDFRQKIQWLGCPNWLLRVQRRFLKEKVFARKKFFPSTSDFELIFFAYLAKKFGRVTKTDFYRSRRDLRRIKIDWNLFFSISSWHWADNFQDYGKKNRKCPQKCILLHSRGPFWRKLIFEKNIINTFIALAERS